MTGTEGITETTSVTGVDTTTRTGTTMTNTQEITGTDSATDTQGSTTGASSEAMRGSGVEGVDDQLVRASALLDYNFENADGEVSGELQDLLIDLDTGRILFTSVEYGGFLEMGDRDLVLPLSAFVIDEEGHLVLNFDEQTLENFPDLGENWPDLTNATWDDEVNDFWTGADVTPWQGFDEPSSNVVWASDLIGYGLAEMGEGAGTISDLLVDLGNGTVRYVLAGYGAGAALDAPFVLPISVLDVTERGDVIGFDADIDSEVLLTAPRLDRSIYPDDAPFEPGFDADIMDYWNEANIDINPWDDQ
jgi:hypothetical protein